MLNRIFKGFGKKEKYAYDGNNPRLKQIFDVFAFNQMPGEKIVLTKQQKIKIINQTNQLRVCCGTDQDLIAIVNRLEEIVLNAPER